MKNQIGEQLRAARRERGLSMRALSKLAGVAVQTIWNVENGAVDTPHGGTLRRLFETLEKVPKIPLIR